MKKLLLIGIPALLSSLCLVPYSSYASKTSFVAVMTLKALSAKKDPKDFVTSFYGLVMVNEQVDAEYEASLSALLFAPELYAQYNSIMQRDANTDLEHSCLDYRVFTGGQDTFNGFWLGKATTNDNKASIPVYLEINDPKAPTKTPNLIFSLVNTDFGWKINDISYVATNKSLRAQLSTCLAQAGSTPSTSPS